MKKLLITIVGGTLVLLGLLFIILPGPSIFLLLPGLVILSLEYPIAKTWLKTAQKVMRKAAVMLDKAILRRKYQR